MLSGETTNTNFIVFGLNRPGLEPTIYLTRDEHAYDYATDAVLYSQSCLVHSNMADRGCLFFWGCWVIILKKVLCMHGSKPCVDFKSCYNVYKRQICFCPYSTFHTFSVSFSYWFFTCAIPLSFLFNL
jgi:hypothetical protein